MNTLGPVPCRWLCPSTWPVIQGEGKKPLQFLSKRWPDGSCGKAQPTVNNKKKLKTAMWTDCHTGVGRDLRGQNKMRLGLSLEPHWLKRTGGQRTWRELLWHRETCSYLARAPPAGRGAELRLLGPLQTALSSLWVRPGGTGKGLWRVPCKAHSGSNGAVIALTDPNHSLCPVTVLCSQINSKQAKKNEHEPDCCFAKFRKLGRRGPPKGPCYKKSLQSLIYSVCPLEKIWTTNFKS